MHDRVIPYLAWLESGYPFSLSSIRFNGVFGDDISAGASSFDKDISKVDIPLELLHATCLAKDHRYYLCLSIGVGREVEYLGVGGAVLPHHIPCLG